MISPLYNTYKFTLTRPSVFDDGEGGQSITETAIGQDFKCHFRIDRNRGLNLNSGLAEMDPHPQATLIYPPEY